MCIFIHFVTRWHFLVVHTKYSSVWIAKHTAIMQKYNHNFQSMNAACTVHNINNYELNRIKRSNQQKMAIGAFTAILLKRRFTKANHFLALHQMSEDKRMPHWQYYRNGHTHTHIHTQIHTLPHTQIDTNILYNRKSFFLYWKFYYYYYYPSKIFFKANKSNNNNRRSKCKCFFSLLLHSFFGMEFFAFIFFAAYFSYSWIFSFVCLLIIVAFLWLNDSGTRCPVIYLQRIEKEFRRRSYF